MKLPAPKAGLPGKVFSFILCPLTPLWRDGARSGHQEDDNKDEWIRSLISAAAAPTGELLPPMTVTLPIVSVR